MFRRIVVFGLTLGLGLFGLEEARAQTYICAADLDGDGDADSQAEQGACTTSPIGNHCPIESVACTASGGTPPAISGATATGVIVNDDGRGGGAFTIESQSVTEGTGAAVSVSVRVAFPPASIWRDIEIMTAAMTATAGIDYGDGVRQSLAPNATRLTFQIPIVADAIPETIEAFRVTVWDAANPIGTQSWGEIRIIDDDAPAPGPGIFVSSSFRDEGNAGAPTLNFLVTMSAPAADTVTVDFSSSDGTAIGGTDYTPVSGTLRFDPGVLTQTIQVPLAPDLIAEGDETLTIALSNASASGPAVCPLNPSRACHPDGAGGSRCSLHDCFLRSDVGGIIREPPSDPPNNDGPRDAAGNCLGALRIFPGMYSRCRTAGTQTHFSNCCRNRGEAMNDTMGGAGSTTQQAAVIGAIAGAAGAMVASGPAAANSILSGAFDPTTFAIALGVAAMAEMLQERCDSRDMQTALLKDSGYCVFIGDYCAEEWPLVGCVQRARGHCCFNSMLARIINEQGRPQIPSMGGFGTPDEPNCRGFTPEEFQALDFSKIDLSEYFAEIRSKSQSLIEGEIRPRITNQVRGGQ